MTVRVASLIATLALSPTALGSTPQEPFDVIRVATRLVLVDVIVVDEDRPVTDLSVDDFRLFDDDRERSIDVFTFTDVTTDERLDQPLPEGVVSNRYDADGRMTASATVILIDRLNTAPFDQPYADQQVREFLDTVTESDRVAVYELTNTLRLVQDYTSDVQLLKAALSGSQTAQTIGLAGSEATLDNRADPALSTLISGGNSAQAEFDRLVERTYLELRADTSAATLEAITNRLSDLPGRKNIVWLSGSFPFSFQPHGHTSLQDLVRVPVLDRMEGIGRLLTRANVAVYPVFAPGLGPSEPTGLDLMLDLADKTGGRAFFNSNGLATAIRQVADEARAVYTLGFYVDENANDTGFHELRVEVARDGVDLRHRAGYHGFGKERVEEEEPTLMELLVRPSDDTGIGLFGTARPTKENPTVYDVVLQIDVRDLSLTYDGESRHGRLELAMYFQPLGDEVRILPAEQMPFHMSEHIFARTLESGLNIVRQIDTEGRTGWLRVVVRDRATGAAGSLRIPIGID